MLKNRREFPAKVKRQAWERCGGHCEECTAKLFPGKFQYDHIIADALGGEPALENCMVLCRACHDIKTRTSDVPTVAKGKRVRDRHLGIRRRGRGFATNRDKPWKRKMDGTLVRR